MAFNMIDAEDKRTDELLQEVAMLQEFEAIPDKLSELIGDEEQELSLDEMDMVRAAGYTPRPDFERFLKKLNQ